MLLAVYGTFRQGEAFSGYLEYLREKGTTEIIELTGIKLSILGMAPGAKVTNDPNDKAIIELIDADISAEDTKMMLGVLDKVEGVAHGLYERSYIDTPKGKALIYTKCGDVSGCVEIIDWMEWQKVSSKEKAKAVKKAGPNAIFV